MHILRMNPCERKKQAKALKNKQKHNENSANDNKCIYTMEMKEPVQRKQQQMFVRSSG